MYFHRSHSWPKENRCQEGCKFLSVHFIWYFPVLETCTMVKRLIYLSSKVLHSLSVYYQLKRQKIRPNLQKWAPVFQCGTAGDHKHSQHLENEALDVWTLISSSWCQMGIFAFCEGQEPQTECKNGIYHKEWETRKRWQQEKMQARGRNERIYIYMCCINKRLQKKKDIHPRKE